MKEGSGFVLGLCDLFWFGKNRDVQRCSQCTARLFPLPQQQTNLVASFSHKELEPRATAQPLAAGVEPGIQLLGVGAFACLQGKFMCSHGTSLCALSSSPGSLGYSSCCGMGTIFLQLAAAEPSCFGVHGLGVVSAVPLAMRIPLTLTSLLGEASTEKELLGQGQEKG